MTEVQEQAEVVKWFRTVWPEHAWSLRCSMSGLPRHGRQGTILWNIMKSLGVHKGEPDFAILLPKGGYGCFVAEHKAAQGARQLTEEQNEHLKYHQAIGNKAVSTRGIDALKAEIQEYMEG